MGAKNGSLWKPLKKNLSRHAGVLGRIESTAVFHNQAIEPFEEISGDKALVGKVQGKGEAGHGEG